MKKIIPVLVIALALPLFVFTTACKKNRSKADVYRLDCRYEDGTLSGVLDFTFFNDTEEAFDELKFNLFPNAYRNGAKYAPVSTADRAKAYYAGASYGDIAVNAVTGANGDLGYEIGGVDMNILTVDLENEVFPDESVDVTIDFTVHLAKINHRLGIAKHSVNLANFYPILCGFDENGGFYECVYYSSGDPFYSEVADYDVTLAVPEGYTVASSGRAVSCKTRDGLSVTRYTIDNARDFAFVLSEDFEVATAAACGVEINYYYYDAQSPDDDLAAAVKAVETFSDLFGAYPYKTLAVVETGFSEGGMEYPALVYISDSLEKSAFAEVIVHETAHQWWYAAVGNNEIKYGFLDEGLTEYSVVLFYENRPEYELTREMMMESATLTYHTYCSVYDKLFDKVDTSMLRALNEYSSEYEYVNIAYIKGCIMFDTLRQSIGDKRFFSGLKKYYEEYKFKVAAPDDLVGVYERLGADSNGFFRSFFDGKAII